MTNIHITFFLIVFMVLYANAHNQSQDILDSNTSEIDNAYLIVGGVESETREFPHQALIGYSNQTGDIAWICGGSLINTRYVLTAAHCLKTNYGYARYVKVGMVNNLNLDLHVQKFEIIQRIPHPDYRTNSHYNDIGLLKLNKDASFNKYVKAICLPSSSSWTNLKEATATGFGATAVNSELSPVLLKVTLDFFSKEQCDAFFKNVKSKKLKDGLRHESQICAGSADHHVQKDTCRGDSGGPLQISVEGDEFCTHQLVGVTSFGKGCGYVGVYTKVAHFMNWIEGVIKN